MECTVDGDGTVGHRCALLAHTGESSACGYGECTCAEERARLDEQFACLDLHSPGVGPYTRYGHLARANLVEETLVGTVVGDDAREGEVAIIKAVACLPGDVA